jgi:integrase/recombinase XerD
MLTSLFPRAHHKLLSMPLLGSVVDGFEDWLSENGYTRGSRKFSVRTLPYVDANLRRRRVHEVASLTGAMLDECWRDLINVFPRHAGTVRALKRYLTVTGLICASGAEIGEGSAVRVLIEGYADHLREVRGFAASTISNHRRTARCFLDYVETKGIPLDSIHLKDIETYISQTGKRLNRGSLQHDIGAVRSLLRFLAIDGRVPTGLDRRIDTPRLYRLEQLPRALPWKTVVELLKSMETGTAMGLRDYAMFVLIATYGLRASEVVSIDLEDIDWRQRKLRIHQRKTSSPLELPLTNEVLSALVKHLKRTPPPAPYRRVFMRMRAPVGVLKPTAVTEAFQALVRSSGLEIPYQGPHCLRHSYAVHLLKNGTPLKTIGDILGHRTAESTSMYLRLATDDLREVALPVPGRLQGKERRR